MHRFDNRLPSSGCFSVKPHWFVLFFPSVVGITFSLIFLKLFFSTQALFYLVLSILFLLWPAKRLYFLAAKSYTITNESVVVKNGILGSDIKIPIDKIENFSLKQPPMGAIFNFAHTTLSTDTSYGDVRLTWIPNCRNFIAKIYNLTGTGKTNHG